MKSAAGRVTPGSGQGRLTKTRCSTPLAARRSSHRAATPRCASSPMKLQERLTKGKGPGAPPGRGRRRRRRRARRRRARGRPPPPREEVGVDKDERAEALEAALAGGEHGGARAVLGGEAGDDGAEDVVGEEADAVVATAVAGGGGGGEGGGGGDGRPGDGLVEEAEHHVHERGDRDPLRVQAVAHPGGSDVVPVGGAEARPVEGGEAWQGHGDGGDGRGGGGFCLRPDRTTVRRRRRQGQAQPLRFFFKKKNIKAPIGWPSQPKKKLKFKNFKFNFKIFLM